MYYYLPEITKIDEVRGVKKGHINSLYKDRLNQKLLDSKNLTFSWNMFSFRVMNGILKTASN